MSKVYIDAVGLAAPGLVSWDEALPILRGERPLVPAPVSKYAPTLLPANEQRRATETVRLAFRVGEEIMRSGVDVSQLATVFASSDADMMVSHRLCMALAQTQRLVSPTDFHNSVHNAPSGYWHIGARSQQASSAIAGHDHSFAAGLLEAITQTQADRQPTLLICYDAPAPEPLHEKRPLASAFAVALLCAPDASSRSIASLAIESLHAEAETQLNDTWESLRLSNPAGRSLPLLLHLAERKSGPILLRRSARSSLALQIAPV
ncbi:MAG TPA: beta-ketoacyl synthase chain length factor [Steroidobacteraceae bacterium]|nr:beta-ketoacyl synthase chain length factor [Steroidobacteraceae bacterium]